MTSNQPQFPSPQDSLARVGAASQLMLVVGAIGSLALMLRAGRRQPSFILIALFTAWVLSPFFGLAYARHRGSRCSSPTRRLLHWVTLCLSAAALGIYAIDAVWPFRPQAAFIYLVVPAAMWLLGLGTLGAIGAKARARGVLSCDVCSTAHTK